MISRVEMSVEEFNRRRERLRSRWVHLIKVLQEASDGEVWSVCLTDQENTGAGRQRARQSIYAIARHYQIPIRICSTPLALLVMRWRGEE